MLAIISGSGGLPLFAEATPLAVPALQFGAPSGQPRRAENTGSCQLRKGARISTSTPGPTSTRRSSSR